MKILKINDVPRCAARAQGVFQQPAKKTSEGIFQYFCDKKFFQKLNFMKILKFLEKERKVF